MVQLRNLKTLQETIACQTLVDLVGGASPVRSFLALLDFQQNKPQISETDGFLSWDYDCLSSFLLKNGVRKHALFVSIEKERRIMLYIWFISQALSQMASFRLLGAIFFVIVNLGLPTVLARMIDQGNQTRRQDKALFLGYHHVGSLCNTRNMWADCSNLRFASKLTTNMKLETCEMMFML